MCHWCCTNTAAYAELTETCLCCLRKPVTRLSDTDVQDQLGHLDVPHGVAGLLVVLHKQVKSGPTNMIEVYVRAELHNKCAKLVVDCSQCRLK